MKGPVVASQYSADGYHISEWAHLVTVHGFPGHRLLDSIASAITKNQDRGILMITDMSSSTAIPGYAERCFQLAQQYKHLVVGLIAQKRFPDDHHFLYLTPGVSLEATGDSLGQRYRTPLQALMNDGCDFVIVGRSITRHYHPLNISGVIESARHYQQVSWAVHLQKQSKLSPSAVVNPLRRQLNDLIAKKKSHLGISVQVSDSKKLLEMATQAGPFIVMLKVMNYFY
jgi:orotidine-5'-phosphate decarboxylase